MLANLHHTVSITLLQYQDLGVCEVFPLTLHLFRFLSLSLLQEMLEEKEKQEKALAKKQKKEKRLEKLAARLQYMAQEAEKSK